jgi:hypothetical protein
VALACFSEGGRGCSDQQASHAPDGQHRYGWTWGLLGRRRLKAIIPFNLIGKEVERRAQEREDVIVLESTRPIRFQAGQKAKTRSADPTIVLRARPLGVPSLMRASGVSQDSVHRFLAGAPVHPATRAKLEQALERLGLKASDRGPGEPCPASGW